MPETTERVCKICGCTDGDPCLSLAGFCYWIEADLCSECKSESGESGA